MCSIFGTDIQKKKLLIPELAIQGEERGIDATGIACLTKNEDFFIYKEAKPASKFTWGRIPYENTKFFLGHTRKVTKGSAKKNYNNHPFISEDKDFVLAHNGTIFNDISLKYKMDLKDTDINTDSYVILQLLESGKYVYKKNSINIDIVAEICEMLSGSFALSILTKNKLYLLRHNKPLSIVYNGKNILYASTPKMINQALEKRFKKDVIGFMGTLITELPEDVIYEYDINSRAFTNKQEFENKITYYYNNNTQRYDYESSTTDNNFWGDLISIKTYETLSVYQQKYYEYCENCEMYYYVSDKYSAGGWDEIARKSLCNTCLDNFYDDIENHNQTYGFLSGGFSEEDNKK